MFILVVFSGKGFAQSIEITRIDSTENVGSNCILKISPSGKPYILYNDLSNYQLKYAVYIDEQWDIYETGLYEQVNDFEVDSLDNLHCSKAAYTALKYLFINADTAFSIVIDSADGRYSDSEIELDGNSPKITCIHYLNPSYLLEFIKINNEWERDFVTFLPIAPTSLSYKLDGAINHVSCSGGEDRVIMYYNWESSSVFADTVYRDSFAATNSLDISNNGNPIISFNRDFSNDYEMVIAEKENEQWNYDTLDNMAGYTFGFNIRYSPLDQEPYVIFIKHDNECDTLYLGWRNSGEWSYLEAYSADIGNCSFDIDAYGDVHFCFYVYDEENSSLYYGIMRVNTAIDEDESAKSDLLNIEIYPNPTNNTALISFTGLNTDMTYKVGIYDVLGRKVNGFKLGEFLSSRTIIIDVTGLSDELKTGVYFISISSESESKTRKFTIIR